ncbi:hypothetical protein U0070_004113 [Myodes glareolus]|uniref:Uncharacterized protein n=1 Tax=Myodes glareolus TaxID=447135 RepID=A0AAW0KAJ7_MYOGA
MIQNRIFGDNLEVVWVVMTIMVTEEASVVMVALAAAVVVVAGIILDQETEKEVVHKDLLSKEQEYALGDNVVKKAGIQPRLPLDSLHDNGFPPSFEVYNDQLHGLVVGIQIAGVAVIQKVLAQPQNGGHPSTTLLDLMTEGLQ